MQCVLIWDWRGYSFIFHIFCDSGERIDSEYGEELDSLVDLTVSTLGEEFESQVDMTDASQLNPIVEQVALGVFPGGGIVPCGCHDISVKLHNITYSHTPAAILEHKGSEKMY